MERYRKRADDKMEALQKRCSISEEHKPRSRPLHFLACRLDDLLRYSWTIFWYLFKHFLSFFCLGDKRHTLEVLAFVGLSVWNTYDIYDLQHSNKDLVEGSEMDMTFGQIFTLVYLGVFMFIVFDSLRGKRYLVALETHRIV